jgi:hypothetical protein
MVRIAVKNTGKRVNQAELTRLADLILQQADSNNNAVK